MLHNNIDVSLQQANQHYQELLAVAEQHRLLQKIQPSQPGALSQTLTYVGELLVTSGEWLKAHGELPNSNRTVVTS